MSFVTRNKYSNELCWDDYGSERRGGRRAIGQEFLRRNLCEGNCRTPECELRLGGRPQARTTIAKAFRPYSDYVMDFLRGEIVRKICSFLSLEVCVRFDSVNVWLAYECNVIGKNYRKVLDSLTLNMAVFLGIEVIRTESGGVLYSGNYYNMILEQDTVSYASDSLKEYFTNYSSPDGWQRMGCFGNLCVAKLHMYNNEEFCYDK